MFGSTTDGRVNNAIVPRLKQLLWTVIDEDYRGAADIVHLELETERTSLPLDSN